jgi:hypothetical protein
MKDSEGACVRKIRIFRAQDRDVSLGLRVFAKKDCRCARGVYARRVTRVGEKGDVTFGGFVKPRSAGDFYVSVIAFDPRAG